MSDEVRKQSGNRYFLMLQGDATSSIPNGGDMSDWCARLVEEPEEVKAEAEKRVLHLTRPRDWHLTAASTDLPFAPTIASTQGPSYHPSICLWRVDVLSVVILE